MFFVPANPTCDSPNVRSLIASNGGRDVRCVARCTHCWLAVNSGVLHQNVEVIGMWALFGQQSYQQGDWGFFSPCVDKGGYTTSMARAAAQPQCARAAR